MAYPEREKLYVKFERHDDFVAFQNSLIELDLYDEPDRDLNGKENLLLQKLNSIVSISSIGELNHTDNDDPQFGEYQEQPYLLDPFLESLVTPVVEKVKAFARNYEVASSRVPSTGRVERLLLVLYGYIKLRGHKAISSSIFRFCFLDLIIISSARFFPHEIADMPIALNFMSMERGIIHKSSQWALRYVMMLWLSLIVMIPFDLTQFDDEFTLGHTARSLESVGKSHLGKAGLERDAAALLLSRLYTRCAMLEMLEFHHNSTPRLLGKI